MSSENHGIINAAITPIPYGSVESNGTVGAVVQGKGVIYPDYYVPAFNSPYHGIVAISATGSFVGQDPKTCVYNIPESRSIISFHEVMENFYRMQGETYEQAHLSSVGQEMMLPSRDNRRNNFPGNGRFNPN
jgi:hypothetical protein